MRKHRLLSSALLSLLLVAAFSMGAFASTLKTDVTGSIEAELAVVQKVGAPGFDLVGRGGVVLALKSVLEAEEGTVRAVINLASPTTGGIGDFADLTTFGSLTALELVVDSAYLEAEGAWWVGGPSVVTRIGRHNVSYSDWVAHEVGHNGIGIAGLQLGLLELDGYVGWTADDRPAALRARGALDLFEFDGTLVNRRVVGGTDRVNDVAVEIHFDPAEVLHTVSTIARDGETGDLAYRVEGEFSQFAGLLLDAAVWSTPENFAPRYADYAALEPVFNQDERGVKIGASTVWEGIELRGTAAQQGLHSDPNWQLRVLGVEAETEYGQFDLLFGLEHINLNGTNSRNLKFGVATELFGVLVGYEGLLPSNDSLESTVTASTTQELPILGEVDIEGRLWAKNGVDTEVRVGATWQAPNGLNLGLHYANYEDAGVRPGNEDGFYATAGYKLSF